MKAHPARVLILQFLKERPEASIREIKAAVGLSSTSHVDYHLSKLMAEGVLRKVPMRWEVIEA